MLPTLLLCAIHESSSLLRRTNVYLKCDTPDRPFTSAHYRDHRDHEAKDVFWDRYWHAQNDHVRPLTSLTSLRDVGPMWEL